MVSTSPIVYVPDFIKDPHLAALQLQNELSWVKHSDAPRHEYYCNEVDKPYTYGRGAGVRTYQVQPWHDAILAIKTQIEETHKVHFEVCFLNRYLNQSDHLGWHADDSPEMDDGRPIAVVSLGVEREIWFREKGSYGIGGATMARTVGKVEKLTLGNGSLLLMLPGMQDTHQHRIPKASFQCGERISLTFRGYVKE